VLAVGADGRVEEVAGGYSDWARWHEQSSKAKPEREFGRNRAQAQPPGREDGSGDLRAEGGSDPERRSAPPGRPRKLSYKDQRELDALPERIEVLEAEQTELQARTVEPDFYRNDADTVAAAMRRLADIEAELERAYERWAELEG
jgi:ATP-binding cassette subfamily F protein uup